MGEELVWACKNGDLDQVKAIVEKPGFDINAELLSGRNGLHFAADYGQKEVLEFLLSKGADINRPDKHGITPLLASIFESKTECVKLLLGKETSTGMVEVKFLKHGCPQSKSTKTGKQSNSGPLRKQLLAGTMGAKKDLKAPDGSSYFECAETDDIKSLLK